MNCQVKAIYMGHTDSTMELNGKEISYRHVTLGHLDTVKNSFETITFSCKLDLDLSNLIASNEYIFICNVPKKFRENGKLKIVEIYNVK